MVAAAKAAGQTSALIDRLTLDEARLSGIADAVEKIGALPDPVGRQIAAFERARLGADAVDEDAPEAPARSVQGWLGSGLACGVVGLLALGPPARVDAGLVHVLEGRRIFGHLTPDENLVAA